MEPIFENRYHPSISTLLELERKFRGPRPAIMIPVLVFYVLMICCAVIFDVWADVWYLIVLVGLTYALVTLTPYSVVWLRRKNAKKYYHGESPDMVVTFGEDLVTLTEGNVTCTVEYSRVLRVLRLKHSYCLMTSKRTAIVLREDGFTKGTFEEFKQFLRQRYPNLTIPE